MYVYHISGNIGGIFWPEIGYLNLVVQYGIVIHIIYACKKILANFNVAVWRRTTKPPNFPDIRYLSS